MLSLQGLRSRLYRRCRCPAPALNSWCSTLCAHTARVPTSPLGTRTLATSKGATGIRGPQISSIFKLRTLRPERLEAVGQEVIDLSGKSRPRVPTLDGSWMHCDYKNEIDARGWCTRIRYPAGTRGVFYYYRPSEGPELAQGVRFRICDSAAEFARGRDLLDTRGDVWDRNVLALVQRSEMRAFLALCRAEQLIDEALIADIHRLGLSKQVDQLQFLLSKPFELNLAQTKRQCTYVSRAKVVRLNFPQYAFSTKGSFFPLKGTIKVRFELSNLPEHSKLGPTLVIRVLDIVDPISVHPNHDGVVPLPVPGTLLQRNPSGRLYALALPLQRQPMAEDLLALAKVTWP